MFSSLSGLYQNTYLVLGHQPKKERDNNSQPLGNKKTPSTGENSPSNGGFTIAEYEIFKSAADKGECKALYEVLSLNKTPSPGSVKYFKDPDAAYEKIKKVASEKMVENR